MTEHPARWMSGLTYDEPESDSSGIPREGGRAVDKQEIERLDDDTLGAWSAQDVEGVVAHFADDAV